MTGEEHIVPLNLPKTSLQLRKIDGRVHVRCLIRNKDLVLTPEEWVRQHTVAYLIQNGTSKGRIAVEYQLAYNGRIKRADIVVVDDEGNPFLLVECKAPDVSISETTLNQAAQYNKELNVRHVILTNGRSHYTIFLDVESNECKIERVTLLNQETRILG